MIIEDDRDTVALFRHVLDLAGYVTEIVLRGDKALERLKIVSPDMILLDLHLAGAPGDVILKKIRSDDCLKDASVIVVTGYPQMAVELQLETDLILYKPVSVDQLFTLIKRFHPVDTGALKEKPYDEITNLYDSNFFLNRLDYSIEHTHKLSGAVFGLLFIDCDNFSLVQQRGQEFANHVLLETADLLRKVVRPYDTVAHFGSGQFFIQVEDLPSKDILHQIAQRVHSNLTTRIQDAFGFEMTANIGMVFCGSGYQTPAEIIRDADIAMFYAKSNPQKNLVIFDPIPHNTFRSPEKYIAIMRAGSLIEDSKGASSSS